MNLSVKFAVALVCSLGATVVSAGADRANAQDAAAGAKVFAKCRVCHQVDRAKGSGLGPNLAGVVGRKAGAFARFNYSPAMARSNIVWDKARLDAFLAAPQRAMPGSRMAFAGLPNPKDRADVIAYLSTNK